MATRTIRFSEPWKDPATTVQYAVGQVITLDASIARGLISAGWAVDSTDPVTPIPNPLPQYALTATVDAALATKASAVVRSAVKTASYTASAGDLVPVDASAANVTVTLPTAPAAGSRVTVKAIAVGAGKTVTVQRGGTDVLNKVGGATSVALTLANQAVTVQYDAGIWTVVSDDIPKVALDAAYEPLALYAFSDDTGRDANLPTFTQVSSNVLTQAQSGLTSLYWPWVIRMDDKIASPLGKYYVYYSTNHSAGAGGVGFAYTDDLTTLHAYGSNPIYQDTTLGSQTENVSVIWDAPNSRFIMYYKQITSSPVGTFGSTNWATSPDGITWTRQGQMITHRALMPGNGLMSYFKPFKYGQRYGAYHALGGGNQYRMAMSWSYDGITWVTDPRPLSYWGDVIGGGAASIGSANAQAFNWHYSFPFLHRGRMWLCGTVTDFVSGGQNGNLKQVIAPLAANMRALAGPPKVVMSNPGSTITDPIGNLITGPDGALYGYNIFNGQVDPPGGTGVAQLGLVKVAP